MKNRAGILFIKISNKSYVNYILKNDKVDT